MLERLKEMYQRSRLDREPDEIVVKDVELLDWKSDCIWDYLDPSEMYENQPWWWRLKTRIRWFPIDLVGSLDAASDDVAEYERGRWDEKPSRWTYLKAALYRKIYVPYRNWRRRCGGPIRRLVGRWNLFWGKDKLIQTRIRLVNAGGAGDAVHPPKDPTSKESP